MDRPLSTAVAQIVSGDSLPTEFLIFAAGDNETLDGVFHFTSKSAKSVIDERLRWGIRLMVDLEHKSVLPPDSIARSTDSMCWADVEIRDGACWGVNAEWTPEGAERLKNKSQIYLSPTFYYNEETLEIEALYNVALVSAPKTLNAPALASAEFKGAKKMDIAQFVALAKSMGAATVEETIDGMRNVVNAFGAPSEKKPEPKEEAKAEEPAAPPAPAQSAAVVPPPAPPVEEKVPAQNSALFSENAQLKLQNAKLGAELGRVESTERRACVAELVKLGAEIPATAWEDDAGSVPVERLRNESISDMKVRIAKLSAAPLPSRRNPPKIEVSSLTPRDLQICAETGCEPAIYAKLKADRGEK